MNPRFRKILLLLLAVALLVGTSFVQRSLNADRDRLNLTRGETLKNAPPVLALTTVALGGFRGLISNALWIRASDLQDEDKFFEMAQLADWITKLEPHFVHVWLVQAWNMAYNISVKFKDYPDRWRWVKAGIELLRDQGLVYNPNELLIYRELAWFFQHKLGANLDDANMYYKQEWLKEMTNVFGGGPPILGELINPQTADQTNRAKILVEKYKMEPSLMKELNEKYGPLEWRLPEAHAIYWAYKGLQAAKANPEKVKQDDIITLERVIYQSMQLAFQRGRLISNSFAKAFQFGPNLDIIPKVDAAYLEAADKDKNYHDHILRAHRNFLRDAVYFLYEHNRLSEAAKYYKEIGERYPDRTLIEGDTNSFPRNVSLDQYAVNRAGIDVNETDPNRIKSAIEGFFVNAYLSLLLDESDRFLGFKLQARRTYDLYQSKIKGRTDAIGLAPFDDIERDVIAHLLNPDEGLSWPERAALRSKLSMPAEPPPKNPPPAAAPATPAPTNAPAPVLNSTNKAS